MLESYWDCRYWTLYWYFFGMGACYFGHFYRKGLYPDKWGHDQLESRIDPPILFYVLWPLFIVGMVLFSVTDYISEKTEDYWYSHKPDTIIRILKHPKTVAFRLGRKHFLQRENNAD